jgi:MSHA biogenesis protein MshM
MYLDYFKFKEIPFGLTPNTEFFCQLKCYNEALNMLLFSLRSGEGFTKIIGEVGTGKTLLCRKLLSDFSNEFVTAYIPNPDLTPLELRKALAHELSIETAGLDDRHELLTLIYNKLLALHQQGSRVILLIDEAQALPPESLEALRLLTNLETEKHKLLQVVLFGQPELDQRLNQPEFRQLKQRISFSYYLPTMSREDLDTYLLHRLNAAGCSLSTLFSKKAKNLLYRASKGVPRIINILCHKALLAAYGEGKSNVTHKMMRRAVLDTKTQVRSRRYLPYVLIVELGIFIIVTFCFYLYMGFI